MKPIAFLKNALFALVPAGLLLSGCAAGGSETEFTPKVDPAYTMQAEMTYADGGSAVLMLSRSGPEKWEAAFSDPASLAGVVLSFDGNAVAASYKGLAFTVPKSALPAKNMLCLTTEILGTLDGVEELPCTRQEDGTWCSEGDCSGGKYEITFAEDGTPAGLSLPSQPLHIVFTGYTVCGSLPEEPAETTEPAVSTGTETSLTANLPETTNEGTSN